MAEHMAQQNAEGSRDLSTLVDASAELQHLVQTIWRLRQPDGCPWDREQTHRSIGKNMIEEAYEALDCIEADDAAHLREELGDVLMQVVLHAQIAADAGEFSLADVARDIDAKLIRLTRTCLAMRMPTTPTSAQDLGRGQACREGRQRPGRGGRRGRTRGSARRCAHAPAGADAGSEGVAQGGCRGL